MSVGGHDRCKHELLPGQCADCPRSRAKKKSVAKPLTGAAAAAQVERLVKAVRAQQRGGNTKAVRAGLAGRVQEKERSLGKAARQRARQIAVERRPAFRPTRAQLAHEDRVAGIYQPWISPQNVGRGKRS